MWDECEKCQNLVNGNVKCGYQYANFKQDPPVKGMNYEKCYYRMVDTPRSCATKCPKTRDGDYDFSSCDSLCEKDGQRCKLNQFGCIFDKEPVLCRAADATRLGCKELTLTESPSSRHIPNAEAIELAQYYNNNMQHHIQRYDIR